MTLPVDIPQAQTPFVDADGQLTPEAHIVLLKMAEALVEAQATIADHEARIVVLEP